MSSHELFPDGVALSNSMELAITQGYAFLPNAVSLEACHKLSTEAASLDLKLDDHTAEPLNHGTTRQVTQLHEQASLPFGDKEVPVATFVARSLGIRVHSLRYRYPVLQEERWLPTELSYQLYKDPNHHISMHRDRSSDKLLGATITLSGSAQIGIHETLSKPDDYTKTRQVDEFRAQAGTIMFLRASGLGSGQQSIHHVSPPENGPRLVLNLRMRPPK